MALAACPAPADAPADRPRYQEVLSQCAEELESELYELEDLHPGWAAVVNRWIDLLDAGGHGAPPPGEGHGGAQGTQAPPRGPLADFPGAIKKMSPRMVLYKLSRIDAWIGGQR
jgi:hypothetical protein